MADMQLRSKESDNSATAWLLVWCVNNIAVTLLNKTAFSKVDFHHPYLLSAIHMFVNTVGSFLVFHSIEAYKRVNGRGSFQESQVANAIPTSHQPGDTNFENNFNFMQSIADPLSFITNMEAELGAKVVNLLGDVEQKPLDGSLEKAKILMFSVIFSLNIAVGNVSLQHVSVNFNQVMRSLVPALTIIMGGLLGKPTSLRRKLAVLPVILGVACACFGDMSYQMIGLFYTILCVLLAALKVVAAGEMLTGSTKLHPVDLLSRMAPLAFIQCIILSVLTGEMSIVMSKPVLPFWDMAVVVGSGFLAFSLNIASLQANKLTSPLTLCIAANVKQVLMLALATIIFSTPITPLNATGIIIVLIGSGVYSYVSVLEKTQTSRSKFTLVEESKLEDDVEMRPLTK